MTILLPHDGSRHAQHAMRFVAARSPLAGRDPTVSLISVQSPLPNEVMTVATPNTASAILARRVDDLLRPACAQLAHAGVAVRTAHPVGVPGRHIARTARDKKVDLIVSGSHDRSTAAGMLLGSAASRVAAHCETPLLLIRRT